LECRRCVLWLAPGKHQQKREKKDARPHVSDSKNRLNVDVANFIGVKVGAVYIAAQMAGMQNVDIANFHG
ncbi:MAG: hypothetical protein WCD29_22930, partial [Pseudolabrys sp.]